MLIDTHAHLDSLENLAEKLEGAKKAGVGRIVAVSSDPDSSERTVQIAGEDEMVYAAVGIHPHEAARYSEQSLFEIEKLATRSKVVAIGETGLDYHYMNSPKEVQKESFRNHIRLAKKLKLPVVVHVRDSHEDVMAILREEDAWETMGVIHCFSGDWETAKTYLNLGFYISFSGVVTFKKADDVRDAARNVPIERLLIETDSPYLAPVPYRGRPNEPAYVRHVAEKVAEVRGISLDTLIEETSLNAKNLFLFTSEDVPTSLSYRIRDSLYLNITNKCTIACVFCGKWRSFMLRDFNLRLKKEPSVDELMEAVGDPTGVNEVVFVGWGESLLRLDVVKEVVEKLKAKGVKSVRIDTDGLANLVHGRNILPELNGCIDSISVSLNAQDAETYARVCPSKYGERAYPEVIEFIRRAKEHIPEVTASVVTVPGVDVEKCRAIVEGIGGVEFRVRTYGRVG
ncbi:MAG: TatD family hydrolase [Thermodesulfobacteriota bacterium]